jgi:hypothetical protein
LISPFPVDRDLDRAVQLIRAGQVVYHGVPSPNPGKIIAFST